MNSRKFAVAISGPRPVQTANTVEVLAPIALRRPHLATVDARKRYKWLRLVTAELLENYGHRFPHGPSQTPVG